MDTNIVSFSEKRAKKLKNKGRNDTPMFGGILLRTQDKSQMEYRLVLDCPDVDNIQVLIYADDPEAIEKISGDLSEKEKDVLILNFVMKGAVLNHMINVFPEEGTIACTFYVRPFDPSKGDDTNPLYEWVAGELYAAPSD